MNRKCARCGLKTDVKNLRYSRHLKQWLCPDWDRENCTKRLNARTDL